MVNEQTILTALSGINDPELKAPIRQLGMVGAINIVGDFVTIKIKLPLPGSPTESVLKDTIVEAVSALEGITRVEIVTELMSDSERVDLANKLHSRPAEGAEGGAGASEAAQSLATAPQLGENGEINETDPQRKQVLEALATVEDPEIHMPLTKLGMVKAIGIAEGDVAVEILLTIPGCPLKDKITNDVAEALKKYDWVENVGVAFGVMTDAQRERVREMVSAQGSDQPAAWKSAITAGNYAKRIIAVCSGKGGVGKSTTTTNLAFALATMGAKVGILDADVYGFSIPRMSGVHGDPVVDDKKIKPVAKGSIQVMSMGYFIDEDAPVIWRGPMLHKAINQFLSDVLWDELDYLFIDMPPGTGDVTLTIAQALPQAEMLIVTTPQPVATHVAGRVAQLAERTKLKLLGVIENMSYFEVNGKKEYIFGKGGGKELAEKLQIPFLGEAPLQIEIRERSDNGNPITAERGSAIAEPYFAIAEKIAAEKPALISA
ncbi:Mrp/NBP35 family ATP-binding protein [Gemmatimonas aurantiaca]|nr:Mrp/NBP35 family ATP-binding protein [Gemmatimonas aurantiaca]